MDMTQNVAEWLNWLSRVRFFLITLLLALVLVLGKTSQLEVSTRLSCHEAVAIQSLIIA